MIGVVIGSYQLVRKLGEGGMGAVYLGQHTLLGRRAAIKVLLPMLSARPDIVSRFFNEARAVTTISDPGIVQVFDFGYHTDGSAFIVMEFLEGEPLDQRLAKQRRLAVPDALRLCRQVATSLAAAHAQHIVHRDLKPENIFLVRDPEVASGERSKILDFGIAKLSDEEPGHTQKTHVGALMGTPVYMSPEQCRGLPDIDHRADIYSLGCVLFHLITGRPPFEGVGMGDLISAHIREPAPLPSSMVAGIPPKVDALVMRCMAKAPADRYGSMLALGAEIGQALQQISGDGVPGYARGVDSAPVGSQAYPAPSVRTPVPPTPVPPRPSAAHSVVPLPPPPPAPPRPSAVMPLPAPHPTPPPGLHPTPPPGMPPGTFPPGGHPGPGGYGAGHPGTNPPGSYPPAQHPGVSPQGSYPPGPHPSTQPPGMHPGTNPPGMYPAASSPGSYPPAQHPGTNPPGMPPGRNQPGSYPPALHPGTNPPGMPPGRNQPGSYPPALHRGTNPPATYPPAAHASTYPPAAPGTHPPGSYPSTTQPPPYTPSPTTIGGSAGQVSPSWPASLPSQPPRKLRVGRLISGVLVLAAVGIGIGVVATRDHGGSSGTHVAMSDLPAPSGSATPSTASGSATPSTGTGQASGAGTQDVEQNGSAASGSAASGTAGTTTPSGTTASGTTASGTTASGTTPSGTTPTPSTPTPSTPTPSRPPGPTSTPPTPTSTHPPTPPPVAAPPSGRKCSKASFAAVYEAAVPPAGAVRAALKSLKACHEAGTINDADFDRYQTALVAKL